MVLLTPAVSAKAAKQNPMALAEQLCGVLSVEMIPGIGDVSVSKPGFVNFSVDAPSFAGALLPAILEPGHAFGRADDAPLGPAAQDQPR